MKQISVAIGALLLLIALSTPVAPAGPLQINGIAPHVPSGSVQLYNCTQVGFTAATCSFKAVPSASELSAFIKFCDKEAEAGYHFLGASGNLGFNNAAAGTAPLTTVTYYVFEAP